MADKMGDPWAANSAGLLAMLLVGMKGKKMVGKLG